MGLITQGPAFARWSDNLGTVSTDGIANMGVGVTPGVSSALGSAVTLLPALAHDGELLMLSISGFFLAGNDCSAMIDILIDRAGGTSWSALIADLLAGFTVNTDYDGTNTLGVPLSYTFPIWIPAGASLGVQARYAHTSAPAAAARIIAQVAGGIKNPGSWWCGQKVETIGGNNAASKGQTHAPGASGAFSSWASLGSATSARAGAVQWAAQGTGSSSMPGRVCRFEFGAGSTQIGPCVTHCGNTGRNTVRFPSGPVFCDIAAGTQLQVRGTSGTATVTAVDVAAYVVQ